MEQQEHTGFFIVTVFPPTGSADIGIALQPYLEEAAREAAATWQARGARTELRRATKTEIDRYVADVQDMIAWANSTPIILKARGIHLN
jgi:hypothetical protein